jgi:mannosyltransferase OCH1-like enzyme
MDNNIIPKIIHQIWFQGYENINSKYYDSHLTVFNGAKNNNWEYMFWDEKKILELLKNYPTYKNIYDYFDMMIQKIDIAKYVILYHHGGVYIDMDMVWIKDFTDLLQNRTLIVSKLMTVPFYSNGILLSKPQHDFWNYYIDEIDKNKEKKWYYNNHLYVQNSTGPILFTKVVNNYNSKNNNNITILDYVYFEPCKSTYLCNLSQDARLKDNFANSWMTPYEKCIIYIYTFFYQIILIILIIFLIYKLFL